MARAFNAVGRRWRYRHEYNGMRDWLLTYYDSILRLFRSWPLPLRDKLLGLSLKMSDRPLFVRLGRADGFFLEEILLRKVYHPALVAGSGPVGQIVDLGGNIGMSVRLWQIHFPEARILVVEPNSGNCVVLRKNIEGSENVTLVQACIGGTARQAYLHTHNRPEGQFRMFDQPGENAQSVPVTTMAQLLQEFGITGQIDLLKCDIEGSEGELFADCQAWIGQVRNLAIEVHFEYTKNSLLEDLRRNGADFVVAAQNGDENVLLLQRRG